MFFFFFPLYWINTNCRFVRRESFTLQRHYKAELKEKYFKKTSHHTVQYWNIFSAGVALRLTNRQSDLHEKYRTLKYKKTGGKWEILQI